MKRLALIGIIFACGLNALSAQWLTVLAGSPPSSVAYDFTETFEGSNTDSQGETGYDNTLWTSSTASNTPRYTTTPAPLAGTYSWLSATSGILSRTITTTGEFHFYFMVNVGTAVVNELMLELRDGSAVTVGAVRLRTTATLVDSLRLEHNGVNSSNAAGGTFVASTTYHIWVDWAKGTGANGTMALYIASTATKPGSPAISMTNGAGATDAVSWRFTGPTVGIIDNIVFDYNTTIGSNPVP